jgi:MoaA/NifB/PqqE/SkfB family radical SAM enzyme
MFLHPDLPGLLAAAHRRKVVLSGENGVNLNTVKDEVLEAIVRYRLVGMVVSIDGASEETYAKYRVGGSFTTVMNNLKRINQFKEQYQSPFPKMRWQFIVFGHNEHEIPKARQMAEELGMGFQLKLAWGDFSPVKDKDFVAAQLGYPLTTRDEFRDATGRNYMDHLCHQLWNQPQINWDGKMLGCCRTFWSDFGGNVFKDGFQVAFNGEKMQYARAMLEGTAEPREDIPCTTCSIYIDRRNSKRWVTDQGIPRKLPTAPTIALLPPGPPAVYTISIPHRRKN